MRPGLALVTGATSGIGRAFADELRRRGWALVLVARDRERLDAVAAELGGCESLAADLTTETGRALVAERLATNHEPVLLLVNAAGCGTKHRFPDEALAVEQAMLDLNVTATLQLSHVAAHAFAGRGGGGVVNIASTAAIWSTGTYAASKAWVLAASRGLADAVGTSGVVVTTVVPGFTRTEFHARSGTDAGGVRSWMWLTAGQVAREGLDAWEAGRPVSIPGRVYRVLVPVARALPNRARTRLLRALGPLRPLQPSGSERRSDSRKLAGDS